jgi:glutathione peroxidase
MIARHIAAFLFAAATSVAFAQQPAHQDPAKPAAPKQPEAPKAPAAKDPAPAQPAAAPAEDSAVLNFSMNRIDGTKEDLSKYKGKVVLIVNVASKCGYTPQYAALEKLYDEKKDQGLVILGFPANNFGGQEPGSNADIAKFCSEKYNVTFPMFQKISVKGPDQDPLYKKLTAQPAPIGGDPKWNFTKFVVDRSGHVVARYDAKARTGLEPDLLAKVDELLGTDAQKKDEAKPAKPASN